jgi:uncharacterized protein YwgA
MQKLVYFSQVTGVPVPCSFEIYHYGPYSDEITSSVDALLADEVLSDQSTNSRYSNYRLDEKFGFQNRFSQRAAEYRGQIERVVKALGGYKPDQLELIATLHFIAHRQAARNASYINKEDVVNEFHCVKGDKFPHQVVESWYDSLSEANLI